MLVANNTWVKVINLIVVFQETMVPQKCPETRSALAPPSEVPEHSGSNEVQDLRAQVATLMGVVQQQ